MYPNGAGGTRPHSRNPPRLAPPPPHRPGDPLHPARAPAPPPRPRPPAPPDRAGAPPPRLCPGSLASLLVAGGVTYGLGARPLLHPQRPSPSGVRHVGQPVVSASVEPLPPAGPGTGRRDDRAAVRGP